MKKGTLVCFVGWMLFNLYAPPPTYDREQEPPYPVLVTRETRADAKALAALQKSGKVLFTDGFESEESFKHYFEIRGLKEGNVKLDGKGAVQVTARANEGKSSGAGLSYWFGPEGYDRVHLRYYIKFAADYNQGNLNHTGGSLAGTSGNGKWDGMGQAGIRPKGDDRLSMGFEPWRDWGRQPAPGSMFLYTYWMDMKRDRDGNYWGNMMTPDPEEHINPQRDRWYCMEIMIQLNEPGKADGELAAWIDGKLYLHYKGFRWRTTGDLKLKRFGLDVYIHQAAKDNTVRYDDVVLSTGYVGPRK
jgi:hypothetical protein